MRTITGLIFIVLSSMTLAASETDTKLAVSEKDFNCVLDMQPVRGFYVDNLIEGQLTETASGAM